MGLYTDRPKTDLPLRELCQTILRISSISNFSALQFCDDSGGGLRRYNVYRVTVNGQAYVLKSSEWREVNIYLNFLSKYSFHTPKFYGRTFYDHRHWLLIEYIPGPDLRDFTDELAYAAAGSITTIMNAYWESDEPDGRFERYQERINKRAGCLAREPELQRAYNRFLARQQTCPRTLCSGDFLQFNAINRDGEVYIIDWAFAGIMPYSLDVARMIAHGTGDRRTFPFYMTDRHREIYVREVYRQLAKKPSWERYLQDIRLAVLNEYVEFIEWELNHPEEERDQVFDYYYTHALALASELNQ